LTFRLSFVARTRKAFFILDLAGDKELLPAKYAKRREKSPMTAILHKNESYRIIGACFEVYKQKGCGFTEPVYQECLGLEFELQQIPFLAQVELHLDYKGRLLTQYFKPDFICFDKILVEIKSLANLVDAHRAQALNYLNATRFDMVLLVNFGHFPKLEYERIAHSQPKTISDELNTWGLP
jgi:GxxExxY protein